MGKKLRNFLTAVFMILLIAAGNFYAYFNNINIRFTGFSVSESYDKIKSVGYISRLKSLDVFTIVFFVQWALLFIVLLFFLVKFLRRKKKVHEFGKHLPIDMHKRGLTVTDLDILYDVLKKREFITTSDISKTFKISNEKALGWAKILEDSNLASIEYPAFSEPEIKLKRGANEEEKSKPEERGTAEKKGREKPEEEEKSGKKKAIRKRREKERKKR